MILIPSPPLPLPPPSPFLHPSPHSSSLHLINITKHLFDHLVTFVTLIKLSYLQCMGKSFSIIHPITQRLRKSSLHCSPWKRDIIHRGEDLFVSDHVVNPLNQGHHVAEHIKAMERFPLNSQFKRPFGIVLFWVNVDISECLTLVQAISPTCRSFHLATYIHTWGEEKKYILLQSEKRRKNWSFKCVYLGPPFIVGQFFSLQVRIRASSASITVLNTCTTNTMILMIIITSNDYW